MEIKSKLVFWRKIHDQIKNHKILLIILSIAILVFIGVNIYIFATNIPVKITPIDKKAYVKIKPKVEVIKYFSPLTGKIVASEEATKQAVTGVMIENSPDARPQSGLKDSGVVFEAIAEGGITRFLVLYQSEKPQIIGPVRSVRLYDVEWAAAFDTSIAHVGGSAAALAEVRNGNYRDIDQFFNSGYYWRANDRYAPHNVYTSFEKLDALNTAKGYTSSTFNGFSRIDSKAVDAPDATNINVTISSYLYNSSYTYDKTTNTYARSQGGAPHLDRENGQIAPSVVIAMYVDESTDLEDGYRENITTIGSGVAKIFQNGTVVSAMWSKDSKTSQIKFTDGAGNDVPLVRGQTWISAVPNGEGGVEWN